MATTLVRRVLNATFLAGLAVAGTALALAKPRPAIPSPGDTGSPAAAQTIAGGILAAFSPPTGAVALSSDPTRPAQLGSPSDAVPVAEGADVHRFFFVAGNPQSLINSISYGEALPAFVGGNGSATASEIYDLAPLGGVARRLEIQATRLATGASALRVDAQAWLAVPRR